MTGTENGFTRQGQDLFAIIGQRSFVGNHPTAHRSGKNRIADDGDRARQSANNIGDSTARMSRGKARFDIETADPKSPAWLKRFCTGQRFVLTNVSGRTGSAFQSIQIKDMITVGMSEKNGF